MRKLLLFWVLAAFVACNKPAKKTSNPHTFSADITPGDIHAHIQFLASDSLRGRETGSPGEAIAARYIADYFKQFGLQPAGDDSTFYQQFTVDMSTVEHVNQSDSTAGERITRNVIGKIEGSEDPGQFIVIGAHFDHLGIEKFGSLYMNRRPEVHNGADDNASGTSGVLELAQYFSDHQPKKSLVFIAFSGEEMGLLGSEYFVENPTIPLGQIQAMINMDMIGRLNHNKLIIFGTGSSAAWPGIITKVNTDSLQIQTVPDGIGASDHTSFYNKNIPVLHYFTDTHADYHQPSDDTERINFEGEDRVLEHLKRLIETIDALQADSLTFTEAPITQRHDRIINGPTLGVMPDYGFSGTGMRITNVHRGGPADKAGLQGGDIIIRLDGNDLKDIYDYMDVLNTLKEGQQTTVAVKRNGQEKIFDITL